MKRVKVRYSSSEFVIMFANGTKVPFSEYAIFAKDDGEAIKFFKEWLKNLVADNQKSGAKFIQPPHLIIHSELA